MGTNYYAGKYCKCCKQATEEYHIGKNSFGWVFSFQALRGYDAPTPDLDIRSVKQWEKVIADNDYVIRNEYKKVFTPEEFFTMVRETLTGTYGKDNDKPNQVNLWRSPGGYTYEPSDEGWLDEEGFSFCYRDFS